jgi:hypothetical protein
VAAVLGNALIVAVARALTRLPSLDDLLRAMNREDSLHDGSRYL